MEVFEAIKTRRSIRKFKDTPVSDEILTKLIDAAMSAPTACNQQPWHFMKITDRAILDKTKDVNPYSGMAAKAPCAIMVLADTTLETKFGGYWVQDCAAATQNLLLTAHDLGLGAVWTAAADPNGDFLKGYKKMFNLPENIMPFALIVLGYPDQTAPRNERYSEERVHTNGW